MSVAVVTYNQVAFLEECIESILAQDYANIEIVVADDASTDGTRALLRNYQAAHGDKFVLKLADVNRGITANQNLALSACSGKYISWMAGDDLMLPSKIRKQVAFLEARPDHAICYHDLEVFQSNSGAILQLRSQMDRPRTGDIRTVVRYGPFNGAVSNMVRRDCSPVGGFDPRIPIASDWLYWVECLWSGGKIGYIDEVLGRHRRHDNNITSGSVRKPALPEIQDHLFSCEVIASRAPHLMKEVNARKADLMISLRWSGDGAHYHDYLRASLSYHVRLKPILGLIANAAFGMRR